VKAPARVLSSLSGDPVAELNCLARGGNLRVANAVLSRKIRRDSRRRLHTNPLRILDSKNLAMQALVAGAPRLLDALAKSRSNISRACRPVLKDAGASTRSIRGWGADGLLQPHGVRMGDNRLGAQGTVCAGGRSTAVGANRREARPGLRLGDGNRAPARAAPGFRRASLPGRVPREPGRKGGGGAAFGIAEALRGAGFSVTAACGGGSSNRR